MVKENLKIRRKKQKVGALPIALLTSGVAPTIMEAIFGRGKRKERKKEEDGEKTYPNCSYRNRNGTNKITEESSRSVCGGTNELYYNYLN